MKHTHIGGALANDNTDFSQYQGRTRNFLNVFRGLDADLEVENRIPIYQLRCGSRLS